MKKAPHGAALLGVAAGRRPAGPHWLTKVLMLPGST